jgi:NADH-quinone oxidoreductase subunit F
MPRAFPGPKYLVCNSDEGEPGTCKDRDILPTTRTSSSRAWPSPPTRWASDRLQLHPRRDLRGLRALRRGAGRSPRRRLPGRPHPGQRLQLPAARAPRLRRLHLRRRDRAARIAGRQEGPAALQAAVPGQLRPLRQADHDQQHRDLRRGAVDHQQRRPGLPGMRQAQQRRHQDLQRGGRRQPPGNYEIPLGTPFAKLLELAGGVKGGALKAVIPGGSSAPVLPAARS